MDRALSKLGFIRLIAFRPSLSLIHVMNMTINGSVKWKQISAAHQIITQSNTTMIHQQCQEFYRQPIYCSTPNYHTKLHNNDKPTVPGVLPTAYLLQHTKLPHKATQHRYINTCQQCQQFYRQPIYCRTMYSSLKHLTVNAAPRAAPTVWRHVKMATLTADFSVVTAMFNTNIQW